MKNDIDKTDLEIMKHLSSNAKISYTELASKILVSASTVHVRVKKLEDLGIIRNFTINIDYKKLGLSFTSYLGVFLDKAQSFDKVADALKKIPQITVIDFTTGQFSVFCKVRARDTHHAKDIIFMIDDVEGVSRTETMISLEESINDKKRLMHHIFNELN